MIAYGIISTKDISKPHVAARVGKQYIDLQKLAKIGLFGDSDSDAFTKPTLNSFIRLGLSFRQKLKAQITQILDNVKNNPNLPESLAIYNLDQIKIYHPLQIGGYTDFYTSKQHATNIGKIFRPDSPLFPNWVHMPIAYNGRASSVVISNHPVKRPQGQILVDGKPQFNICKKLDIEVELGVVIGRDSILGQPITIDRAHEYIFGVCLLNDWSARDIQAWEYQPLGPFNSKSFLTSISSFIVPIEELEPYKIPAGTQEPKPLQYLQQNNPHMYDLRFDVMLKTKANPEEVKIVTTNFKHIYWTMEQWITQHTVTGCNLKVGDILASGTISGDSENSLGSLMELTINGTKPLDLPNGEKRSFLEDGDEVIIRGYAGTYEIGEVSGVIVN